MKKKKTWHRTHYWNNKWETSASVYNSGERWSPSGGGSTTSVCQQKDPKWPCKKSHIMKDPMTWQTYNNTSSNSIISSNALLKLNPRKRYEACFLLFFCFFLKKKGIWQIIKWDKSGITWDENKKNGTKLSLQIKPFKLYSLGGHEVYNCKQTPLPKTNELFYM